MSNNTEGCYIYGITAARYKQELGPIGIGGRGDIVYKVPYQDIAAIVSRSPIVSYPVTKENAIAHAKVLEKAGEEGTVLPVRFCTIADNEEMIVEMVLKPRYQEFIDSLRDMEGKVELGVRARWIDLNAIFGEVVEENEDIKSLKEALLSEEDKQKKYAGTVKVGQMVQEELEEKRKREAEALMKALEPLSLSWKENKVYGDMNIVNAAFLVAREKVGEFDQKILDLEKAYEGRKRLKYVSSSVPYNFVEIEIQL
jgi:hypothetical protein